MPLLILAVILLLAVPSAHAGTYEHHTISPASPGHDGWTPAVAAPGGHVSAGVEPDALWGGFFAREAFDPGDLSEWSYAAPAGTTVTEWAFDREVAGIGAGDWNTTFYAFTDERWRLVAFDVPSVNRAWDRLHVRGLAASRLIARLVCGGPRACHRSAPGATLRVRAARVVLHDQHAPAVGVVQGDLVQEDVLTGTARLAFSATDHGGGLYRTIVEVDGRAQAPAVVDGNGGRCRDLDPSGEGRQFAFRVPCASAASATVALDTAALSDGRHVVSVHVEDAAGNRATVYGPTTKAFANRPPGPPVAAGAAPFVGPRAPAGRRAVIHAWLERGRRRTRTAVAPYGERVRIRGWITDAGGRPLAGAALSVIEELVDGFGRPLPIAYATRASSATAGRPRWPAVTGVKTRRNGRFTLFTRVGPSRRIGIVAADGARSPRLVLQVRPAVSLAVTREGLVRGRVQGGYVPRGTFVELQMRAAGRWVTRAVARTRAGGRFAGRLAGPPGATIRARLRRQPRLPYAAAVSPPRTVARTAARTSR